MKNTSNENLFTVIYFSAILDLKKRASINEEKMVKNGRFMGSFQSGSVKSKEKTKLIMALFLFINSKDI